MLPKNFPERKRLRRLFALQQLLNPPKRGGAPYVMGSDKQTDAIITKLQASTSSDLRGVRTKKKAGDRKRK